MKDVDRSKKVILIGGGSHSYSLLANLRLNKLEIQGYIAPRSTNLSQYIKYLGNDELISKEKYHSDFYYVIAFCYFDRSTRDYFKNFIHNLSSDLLLLPNLIHPTAFVDRNVIIQPGTVIGPNAMLNVNVTIGSNCVINSGAIIEHGSTIGDGCHIAPGSIVCGEVTIGDFTLVGAGSIVLNNKFLEADSIIPAGRVVFT